MESCRIKFMFLHVVLDVLLAITVIGGFFLGTQICLDFLRVSVIWVIIYSGILGIAVCSWLYSVLKNSVLFLFKNAIIYTYADSECSSVLQACKGCLRSYKSMFAVPVFNKIIRGIIHKLAGMLEKSTSESALSKYLETLNDLFVFKCGKKMIIKTFDYFDECILAYCYKHPDVSLCDGSIQAFAIFIRNLPKLLGIASSISILSLICNVLLWVCGYLLSFKFFGVSAFVVIVTYVVLCSIRFVLEDAVLRQVLMGSLISTFLQYDFDETEDEQLVVDLKDCIPDFEDLISGVF